MRNLTFSYPIYQLVIRLHSKCQTESLQLWLLTDLHFFPYTLPLLHFSILPEGRIIIPHHRMPLHCMAEARIPTQRPLHRAHLFFQVDGIFSNLPARLPRTTSSTLCLLFYLRWASTRLTIGSGFERNPPLLGALRRSKSVRDRERLRRLLDNAGSIMR